MFISTINAEANEYRALSSDNKSLYKGSKSECQAYISNHPKLNIPTQNPITSTHLQGVHHELH